MKRLFAAALMTTILALPIKAGAAECGAVTIADMNWASATLIANIDQFFLSHGYGCEAELVPGDTMPTITSMSEKGKPDIMPELWSNSQTETVNAAVAAGRLVKAGPSLSEGAMEGFWIPKYMLDKEPSLATIDGLKAHPELFENPEDPSVGALYNCPSGWNCQLSTANMFRAFGLEEAGFELVDTGSGAGLDGSLIKAYERGEGWVGYYWAPTAILGRYDMVKVDFQAPTDVDHFRNCIALAECEDPQKVAFPSAEVLTITTKRFQQEAPEAYAFIAKRAVPNEVINNVLAWMEDEQADGETAVMYFINTYEDAWKSWVTEDAAVKIKQAAQ